MCQAKAWTAIDRLLIIWKSDLSDKIKRDFFQVHGGINTIVSMHHIDTDKMHREKAKQELHKNATSYVEQILETTPHKTTAERPLTSHLSNHTSKIYRTLLEKQGQIYKWCSPMDPFTWPWQCWLTSKNLQQFCVDTGCNLEDLLGVLDDRDGWKESGKSVLTARLDICQRLGIKKKKKMK